MSGTPTPPRTSERTLVSAGTVFVIGLIALSLGTVLNAASLQQTAERQPLDSPTRGIAIALIDPIVQLAQATRLDTPRDTLEKVLGRSDIAAVPMAAESPSDPPVAAIDPSTSTTTSSTVPTPDEALPSPDTTVVPPTITSVASTTGTTSTTTTTLPAPTEDDPLVVWIIGDSFMELLGPAIRNYGADSGVIEASIDFRFITGLTRPDYFDWPAHIRSRLPAIQPDAVVVMFGGNDGQPFRDPGGWIPDRTPEWHERYAAVVGEAMDLLLDGGVDRVYWIGLPIMRGSIFTEKVVGMNEVYREESEARGRVTYISSFEVFQDQNGEYSTYLRDENGKLQRMRAPDGAHLHWPGAYRLADVVLAVMAGEWGFTWRG